MRVLLLLLVLVLPGLAGAVYVPPTGDDKVLTDGMELPRMPRFKNIWMEELVQKVNKGRVQADVASARPAASAVTKTAIYIATDTGVISKSNGTTWTTVGTISGGGGGDITNIWNACATGDCNALVAASGDTFDASNADSTTPTKVGTAPPGTCTIGQKFFDSDAILGQQSLECVATNRWVPTADVVIDVRAYGAKGDNSTSDTTALQAASDACKAAGGGTIFAPRGTYLHGQFTVASTCALVGAGIDATTFHCNDTEPNICIHASEAHVATNSQNYGDPVSSVTFRDFTLDGEGETRQANNASGYGGATGPYVRGLVVAHGSDHITIDGVRVIDGGSRAIEVNPSHGVKIVNSFCEDSSHVSGKEGDCIHVGNPSNNGTREPAGWGAGSHQEDCYDVLLAGNTVYRMGDTALSAQFCRDVTIANNRVFGDEYFGATPTNDEAGIDLFGVKRGVVIGNEIRRTKNACIDIEDNADATNYLWTPQEISVLGNKCYGNLTFQNTNVNSCTGGCIYANASHSSCSGNVTYSCAADGDCTGHGGGTCGQRQFLYGLAIEHNYIQDATTEAIRLNSGVQKFSVQGNTIVNVKTCPANCYQAGGGATLSANDAAIGPDASSSQSNVDYGIIANNEIDAGTGAIGVGVLFRNSSASTRGLHVFGNKVKGQTFSPVRITATSATDERALVKDWNGDTFANLFTSGNGNGAAFESSGSEHLCTDCRDGNTSATIQVAASGSGCIVRRTQGVWRCGDPPQTSITAGAADVLDGSAAARTAPNKTTTSCAGNCTVGDTCFDSDATAGRNVYGCTTTGTPGTWTLQGDGGSSFSCPASVVLPMATPSLPGFAFINTTVSGTLGQLRCGRFLMPCDKSPTKLAFRVGTAGASGAQCSVGVYSLDGNTKLLDSGVIACDASGDKSTTGLSASLVQGTEYWVCVAGSVTATLQYLSVAGVATVLNTYQTYQATAANVAQFNDACTASVTPYACCTGSKTGTCTGMPTTLGTLTAGTPFAPVAVVSD